MNYIKGLQILGQFMLFAVFMFLIIAMLEWVRQRSYWALLGIIATAVFVIGSLSGCGREPSPMTWVAPAGPKGDAGETGAQGPAGAPGSNGVDGAQGSAGADGVAGKDGVNGTDATPVTAVQLCPGTTTYPSTFVEIAFCLGGKLYATYSANGGFSTEIPPGTYTSNGIGSSCTFTVSAGCQVN